MFEHLEELLGGLKTYLSKIGVNPTFSISKESILKMFSSMEFSLNAELAPLLRLVHLMPTDAPPVTTWVQG